MTKRMNMNSHLRSYLWKRAYIYIYMLSSRGSINTNSIIYEAILQSATVSRGKTITVPDGEKVWVATCKVIRQHVLLGHPVCIPRVGGFWAKQCHVATDGVTKYYMREVQFGFYPSFISTYGLDSMVPRTDSKIVYEKIPLDIISQEACVPADIAKTILQEVFLYIGEGIYRSKIYQIDFNGILTVFAKKERAHIVANEDLARALLAVDSRKWPASIRDIATQRFDEKMRPRSSRPSSRGSSLSTPRSRVSQESKNKENQILFINALPRNKTFDEIKNMKVRPVLRNVKKPRKPLVEVSNHIDPMEISQRRNENIKIEESAYNVISPRSEAYTTETTEEVYENNCIEGSDDLMYIPSDPVEPQQKEPDDQIHVPEDKKIKKQMSFPWNDEEKFPQRQIFGRKRFDMPQSNIKEDNVKTLLYDNLA
eukprot:Tbor_TRINITY_DN5458_c0_g1::TRINITY_DN5458_c0_g1_i5::g.24600::m.24600